MTPADGLARADELARAARAWLDGLDAGQRAKATFSFASPERVAWDYRPGERGGLALADMRPDQRSAAKAVVGAAMSARGAEEVDAIIELETILGKSSGRPAGAGTRATPSAIGSRSSATRTPARRGRGASAVTTWRSS